MKKVFFSLLVLILFIECKKPADIVANTVDSTFAIKYPYTDTFKGVLYDTETYGSDVIDTSFQCYCYISYENYLIDGKNTYLVVLGGEYMTLMCAVCGPVGLNWKWYGIGNYNYTLVFYSDSSFKNHNNSYLPKGYKINGNKLISDGYSNEEVESCGDYIRSHAVFVGEKVNK
jgi:hypothetical protein